MGKTKEQIEKDIIDFLDGGGFCALGTCKDNVPRVTPVSFQSEGMNIWIVADPGGKVENVKSNPKVAVAVYERMIEGKDNTSLQIFGEAELVTYDDSKEEFMTYAEKRGMLERLEQRKNKETGLIYSPFLKKELPLEDVLRRITFMKVVPDEVVYLFIPNEGETYKARWKKE